MFSISLLYSIRSHNFENKLLSLSLSLPTIAKVFERVIYNQLYNYLNTHDIITSCQYGFRRHHSTELAAIELVDRTTSELDHYKIPFNINIAKIIPSLKRRCQNFKQLSTNIITPHDS